VTIPDSEPLASLSAMSGPDAKGSRSDATPATQALPKNATFDQVCEIAVPRLYGLHPSASRQSRAGQRPAESRGLKAANGFRLVVTRSWVRYLIN
jgi:hypothetical protein